MSVNFFASFPSNGGSGGVSTLNTLTGALTLIAGSGITITPSGNTLTIDASGGGANTALSNLVTTAINQDLLPNADNTYSLGSAISTSGFLWEAVYTHFVGTDVAGMVPYIALDVGQLVDASIITSIDWQSRTLNDTTGAAALEWGAPGQLNLASGARIINMSDPVNPQDAATKNYVDTSIPAAASWFFQANNPPVNPFPISWDHLDAGLTAVGEVLTRATDGGGSFDKLAYTNVTIGAAGGGINMVVNAKLGLWGLSDSPGSGAPGILFSGQSYSIGHANDTTSLSAFDSGVEIDGLGTAGPTDVVSVIADAFGVVKAYLNGTPIHTYSNNTGLLPLYPFAVVDGSGAFNTVATENNPALDIGVNGDFFVNTVTNSLFEKIAGVWTLQVNFTTLNALTGAVTLAAGTGITITPSGNTLTIDSAGGASTALDNLTTTAINQPLIFNVSTPGQVSSGVGQVITISSGASSTGTSTGAATLVSGDATQVGFASNTGIINIGTGNITDATATGNTGNIVVTAGTNAGSGTVGVFELVNTHLRSIQITAPTIAVQAAAGTGASASIAHATDTAGQITIITGTVGLSTGSYATITFNHRYASSEPIVLLTPAGPAISTSVYVTASATTFDINFALAGGISTTYVINYMVMETT